MFFIDAVGQVAAGFGQAVCVHAVALRVEDAVVGGLQIRRGALAVSSGAIICGCFMNMR